MGIEHFDPECSASNEPEWLTDYVLLVGGTVLSKTTGENLQVVTDDEGVKYFQFQYDPREEFNFLHDPHEPLSSVEFREKYPSRMTVRADQVIGIVQQPAQG